MGKLASRSQTVVLVLVLGIPVLILVAVGGLSLWLWLSDQGGGYATTGYGDEAPGTWREFHVRVVAKDTGEPLVGARIDFAGTVRYLPGVEGPAVEDKWGQPNVLTDVDGRFGCEFLCEGEQGSDLDSSDVPALFLKAAGFEKTLIMAQPGHETPATARLYEAQRSASIDVFVTDAAGEPREGVEVVARGRFMTLEQARTDAEGRCEIDELGSSSAFDLFVRDGERWIHRATAPLLLEAGETRRVDLRIEEATTLRGTVVNGFGAPLPSCKVLVLEAWHPGPATIYVRGEVPWPTQDNSMEPLRYSARTNDQGEFAVPQLPAGAWWVGIAPVYPEYAMYGQFRATGVKVAPGQAEAHVRLEPWNGFDVQGTVVRPDGEVARSVPVRILGRTSCFVEACVTDDQGCFAFADLPPGEYAVQAWPKAWHPNGPDSFLGGKNGYDRPAWDPEEDYDGLTIGRSDAAIVRESRSDLTLALRTTGCVRGTQIGDANLKGITTLAAMVPAETIKDGGFLEWATIKDRTFEADHLIPGPWTLITLTEDLWGRATFEVTAGETTEVDFSLQPAAKVRVRNHGPHALAEVRVRQGDRTLWRERLPFGRARTLGVPPGEVTIELESLVSDWRVTKTVVASLEKVEVVTFE